VHTPHNGLRGVQACMFDFYGTVVDMQGGLVEAITPYLARKGYTTNSAARVVTWWRRTHFENSMIDALLHRSHTPYRQIGQEALGHTLERAGIDYSEEEVAHLVSSIERLAPFPDVVEALCAIQERGLQLLILSNGDPEMLASGVAYSGTEALWDRVISVETAGAFKPHATTYSTAARVVGLEAHEVLFVANHAFDCVGAKSAGMRTAFVNRRQRPFGNSRYPPDLVVADFTDLATTVVRQLAPEQRAM
jgi:2-haloacid dehalogenase